MPSYVHCIIWSKKPYPIHASSLIRIATSCSFFRLILRAIAQSFFLSPKSEDFLVLMPAHRPHVFAVFIPNMLCILLHIVTALPEANETARGYLHGGAIVDFIGQKAPSSKLGLVFLDLVVLALQCFMLAVHSERERLRKVVRPLQQPSGATANDIGELANSTMAAPTGQDADAEERGILRQTTSTTENTGDIELQPLPSVDRHNVEEEPGESSRSAAPGAAEPDLGDLLRSGNVVLADFHVIHALRTSGNDYQSAAAHSLQAVGYAATLARLAAERRARLETQQRPQ